jgi:transcriptional regulator with XRE-family HTH domain
MRGNFFYKKLGERISQIRKSKKLSQYELADAARINRNYLAMVELGRANPSVKFLRKLAIAMQVKIENFLKNL